MLPQTLRRLAPDRLRDDPRLRALAVGGGLIPPRTMHSAGEAALLQRLAGDQRCVVEIGVFEGSSARVLRAALAPEATLHLVDPFTASPDALRPGARGSAWATRRAVARAPGDCALRWHLATSERVAREWSDPLDLVFIDGDHSEVGCRLDWELWHPLVVPGGVVVFHDARDGRPGGHGLPGPTAVVDSLFRPHPPSGWSIEAEVDSAVAARREP